MTGVHNTDRGMNVHTVQTVKNGVEYDGSEADSTHEMAFMDKKTKALGWCDIEFSVLRSTLL